MRILLSSQNPKKRAELASLLAPLGIEVVSPEEVGGIPHVEEDGATFEENAAKKALSAARATGLWSLADDSGLEVDALDGRPGVRSARYAGEGAGDAQNNLRLLEKLAGIPSEQRSARFVCALALARPDGTLAVEVRGVARGRILEAPRGATGFGYDPLFLFTEESPGFPAGRTFAELESREKSVVSHRGRALRELAKCLPSVAPLATTGRSG